MKRIMLTSVLILIVSMVSFAAQVIAEGQTFSILGDYKISQAEKPVILNGKSLETFVISYDNTNKKVIVAVEKVKRCKKYYVLSEDLSVQYECNGNYFGIKKLDKELASAGYKTSEELMNKEEYFYQKVISQGRNTNIDNLKLIAAYYPGLIKESVAKLSLK